MILYKIVEGDSDLELSDEENDEDEFQPVMADEDDEEGEEEGESDTESETEQEGRRALWARTKLYVLFSFKLIYYMLLSC